MCAGVKSLQRKRRIRHVFRAPTDVSAPRLLYIWAELLALTKGAAPFSMTRLDGKKPNAGAIIVAAVIFALMAGGLFFAFRPVPEPTDAGLGNSAAPATGGDTANAASNATSDNGDNSLTTILTPLPEATAKPSARATDTTDANPANATKANSQATPTAPSAAPEANFAPGAPSR